MEQSGRTRHARVCAPIAAALAAVVAATACGHNRSTTAPSASDADAGPIVFQVAPMDMAGVTITPLGNLVPPDHTLPTDHLYFDAYGSTAPRTVVAPAAGVVEFVQNDSGGGGVGVRSGQFVYIIGTLQLAGGLRSGARIALGQVLGTTAPGTPHIDFGLINYTRTLSFANPARYASDANTLYCDSALAYFTEPLRTQLYAAVQRVGSDRDGRIDFDVAGRLAGNWYVEGLSAAVSQNPPAWPQQLAFVRDNYDPSRLRISIGGTLSVTGLFEPAPGTPDFAGVSPASGTVAYPLLLPLAPGQTSGPQPQRGVLIVRMLDDSRIEVETVAGAGLSNTDFSGAAKIYVR